MSGWVMLSPEAAQEKSTVVGFEGKSISADSEPKVMEVLQRWVDGLRELARTELISSSIRQGCAQDALQHLLEVVSVQPRSCMAVELIEGECLIFARESVLRKEGAERLVERAHRECLLRAKSRGEPYNTEALAFYETAEDEQHG